VDLYEHQGKDLFARAGIPLAERTVATTPDEAAEAAKRLGGHVVLHAGVGEHDRRLGLGVEALHGALQHHASSVDPVSAGAYRDHRPAGR
jgi:succinyl-CoA synthetase beta subunit